MTAAAERLIARVTGAAERLVARSRDRLTGELSRFGSHPGLGWLVVVGYLAYVVYATLDWQVPSSGGLRFAPVWGVCALGLAGLVRLVRGRLGPTGMLASAALAGMLVTDLTMFWTQDLRDLHLYLKAGANYLDGNRVYLDRLITERPADLTDYPFLYPPLTLPFFAVLAELPRSLVDGAWVIASGGLAIGGLRAIGLPWRWCAAALVWPPFAQGLYVGNVAMPVFALFAAAPWLGLGLVVAAIFKLYSGIGALWLVRERHLGALVAGVLVTIGLVVTTLPLTGIDRWLEWLSGLGWYSRSQPLLPGFLYGIGLPRYVPAPVGVAAGLLVLAAAIRARGHVGLARVGVATVAASPSLFPHGLLVVVPSLVTLPPMAFWLAIGITSVAPGLAWWAAIGLLIASWLPLQSPSPAQRRRDDDLHPLGSSRTPWPTAPGIPLDE
ncbi:MAG TPA: glycosyltransferase family 87 protein, partial [Candidatus Limnocylindrales bacterium]